MSKIRHRMQDYKVNPKTETLVVGTFNPDIIENPADFFYGRSRNYLWKLIPGALGEESLKDSSRESKQKFINRYKIDFIDLIEEVNVDVVDNYADVYLDSRVTKWWDVIGEIKGLKKLKRVCLTRKTFTDIPNIKVQIDELRRYCEGKRIEFECLPTPARFYSQGKQETWTSFFERIREK